MDSKGRVSVPVSFRSTLETRHGEPALILTLHIADRCLRLYPVAEWERIEEKANTLPDTDPSVAAFKRRFIGSARECELDRQGRILIPPEYREYARLNASVTFLGLGSKMEIWDRGVFEEKTGEIDPVKVMEDITALGGIM